MVRQIKLQPHAKTAVHVHSIPTLLYVKSGEITVVEVAADGTAINQTHVSAGEALPELVDTPHYMYAHDSPALLFSYHAGVVGLEPSEPKELGVDPEANVTISKILNKTTAWDNTEYGQYPSGVPELSLVKIMLKPKATLYTHIHIVPNVAYVEKGLLAVHKTQTTQKTVIGPGDFLPEVTFLPHYGFNKKSDEDVVLLVIYTGAQGLPFSTPYGGPSVTGEKPCVWAPKTNECKVKAQTKGSPEL